MALDLPRALYDESFGMGKRLSQTARVQHVSVPGNLKSNIRAPSVTQTSHEHRRLLVLKPQPASALANAAGLPKIFKRRRR